MVCYVSKYSYEFGLIYLFSFINAQTLVKFKPKT